ncbi:XkdF-like putative serine protease domain-containing protein [Phascolarctobacterium faecium]|uniref:XkdF-like putative serine protease domain-containing protein n=1 Tax=Phascolarctobacterium faecium TaxID=33025 RepID=UPI002E8E1839|nr:XkdF-like putative serine protease domain-containing protein [Phascolarctobacterium faecium]
MDLKRVVAGFNVEWISLVGSPANQKKIILKSTNAKPEDQTEKQWNFPLTKVDVEKRIVYGLVAVPNEIDTDGDMYTPAAVEKAMENFMACGYTQFIDREHDYNKRDCFVRESWIVKENDPMFAEVGAWAVGIKVMSDDLWDVVKSGGVNGLSLAGWAYESLDPESAAEFNVTKAGKTISEKTKNTLEAAKNALVDALEMIRNLMPEKNQKNNEVEDVLNMKKEELEALIKSTVTEAVKSIQEGIETLKKSENDGTAGKGAAGDTGTGEADQNDGTGTGDDTGEGDLTGEQIAEVIKSTVVEVVKPIQADIQMLKSVGIMRANTEPGISKSEKEQSPFDGSFVPGSLD